MIVMHTNSPGARPQAGVFQILNDPGVKALWKTLTSEQQMLLLGSHDSLREVTLGDILQVRRVIPEPGPELEPVGEAPFRNFAAANTDGCPACSTGKGLHKCFGPGVALVHGKAVR